MGKQVLDRTKKALAVLLVVFYITTLTAVAVNAAEADGSCDITSTSCTGDEGTYRIKCSSDGSDGDGFKWTFGDGGTSASENPSHTYQNCKDHTVKLKVTNSSDDSEDITTIGTF